MNTQTQLIIKQLQKKDVLTVAEIAKETKIRKPDVFGELRRLEKRGYGKLVIGRRGNPSRFVQKTDMEAKVNDLWKTKFASKTTSEPVVKPSPTPSDWDVKITDVNTRGDMLLVVAVPANDVGAFMAAVKEVRHKDNVH